MKHIKPRMLLNGCVKLFPCPQVTDQRGLLAPFDFSSLPFTPCRAFTISNVPAGTARGQHAHRSGKQLLVCLQGKIEVLMRYQQQESSLTLTPFSGLLEIDSGVWAQQTYIDNNSILLVFASEPYSPETYLKVNY